MLARSLQALALALTCPLAATAQGYLFATFKGEQTPLTEQIYFATSSNGREWHALNGGEPALVSTLGEKGVRDPYLVRAPQGNKFYLIATDLSIHLDPVWKRAAQQGSKSIVVWESADLVKWSEPRLVRVAADDAGCTWAPEAVYDEENGDYLVFWASTNASDGFEKFRIWAARTQDFATFGAPFIYIEREFPVIDTTIVRDAGRYHRFTKNERARSIFLEVSDKLDGPWQLVPDFSLAHLHGYEGPEAYLLEPAAEGRPAVWSLILDHYAKGAGYQPYVTRDLAGGKFEPGEGFSFPFRFRHGSVLRLEAGELERLRAADRDSGAAK